MISGQFAHTINTEDLSDQMPANVLCLPTYLKQLGYKTGVMLKDHMGANVNFEERIAGGYNKDGSGLWSTTVPAFGDFVERSGADPFFVWVGFIDPHRGYTRTSMHLTVW
jgi:arylsulfatase A-like enzyme